MIPGDLLAIASETPPEGPVVYFLCWNETVVYVGSSLKPALRVQMHRMACRVFDRVLYLPCHPEWMEQAELMWVYRLQPRHNRAGHPMPDRTIQNWGQSIKPVRPADDEPPEAHDAFRSGGWRELRDYRVRIEMEKLRK